VSELDIEGVWAIRSRHASSSTNRFESIYQTTTREKNRPQLQKDLISAHEAGIENLWFTEDYRITGDSLQEMMFFHVDTETQLRPGAPERRAHDRRKGAAFQGAIYLGSGIESSGKGCPELEMENGGDDENRSRLLPQPRFSIVALFENSCTSKTFGMPVIAEVMILRTARMAQF
jgi:hypothetical protein